MTWSLVEGNVQDLERHRHQVTGLAIGLIALQLRLLGQLIALEVGITGNRVVASRPQIGLTSAMSIALLFQLLPFLSTHRLPG